jgi:PPOX class probable F420-dependent enzyme
MPTPPVFPEPFRDLLKTDVAILATIGPDDSPQVTAVWFLHENEGDVIKISLNDARQKTKNLRQNPKATLFILDPLNPYRSLEIRGRADLEPDSDFSFAAKVGIKYGDDVHARDREGETRSIVTLTPTKIQGTNLGG